MQAPCFEHQNIDAGSQREHHEYMAAKFNLFYGWSFSFFIKMRGRTR